MFNSNQSLFKKWLREPLVHFLLIGGVLFFLYGLENEGFDDQSKRIVFTKDDISRLTLRWEKTRQRPPTQIELKDLIKQQIREQVMYREALAMGLDKNDSIVRRRLAQKVEFITADLAAQVEPSEAELTNYLATHSELFEIPVRISFVHVYFNTDRRGEQTEKDIQNLLSTLTQTGSKIDISQSGDPFMLGLEHTQLTEYNVTQLFGKNFASKLFALEAGHWQGPIQSGFGLHLVRTDNKTASSRPELKAVRVKVRNEWMNQQRRVVDDAFYQSLRQGYEIVIDDDRFINLEQKDSTASTKK